MPQPCRLSSMLTESTRNGMSSVTTSTTVWLDCQPCCSDEGVNSRMRGVPGWRFCASCQWATAAP